MSGYPPQQPGYPPYPASPYPQTGYPTTPHFQAPTSYTPQQPLPYTAGTPVSPAPSFNNYSAINRGFSGSPANSGFPHQQPPFTPPHQSGFPPQQPPQFPHHPQPHHQPSQHNNNPLPKPSQVPGLPPKPNIPGLPPKPMFTANGPPAAWGQNLHGQHHPHHGSHQQQPHLGGTSGFQPSSGNFSSSQATSQHMSPNGPSPNTPGQVLSIAEIGVTTSNGTTVPPDTAVPNAALTGAVEADIKKKDDAKVKLVYDDDKLSPVSTFPIPTVLHADALSFFCQLCRKRKGLYYQNMLIITGVSQSLLRWLQFQRRHRGLFLGNKEDIREWSL